MAAAGSVPARFAHHVRFAPSPPLDTCVAPAPLWGSRAGGWTPPRSAAAFTPRNHACLHHALARLPGQGGWPVVRASPVSPGIRERPFASVTSPHGIPLARTADSLVRVSRRVESAPNTVARHRGTSTAATTSPGTRPGTAGARVRARAPAPPPGCHPVTGPALGGARGGEPPAPAGGAGTVQAGRGPCPPPPLEGGGATGASEEGLATSRRPPLQAEPLSHCSPGRRRNHLRSGGPRAVVPDGSPVSTPGARPPPAHTRLGQPRFQSVARRCSGGLAPIILRLAHCRHGERRALVPVRTGLHRGRLVAVAATRPRVGPAPPPTAPASEAAGGGGCPGSTDRRG